MYIATAIQKHHVAYRRYKELSKAGRESALQEVYPDSCSGKSALMNIDWWVKETVPKFTSVILDFANGNKDKATYTEIEIEVIDNLYLLKMGREAPWK